MPSGDNNINLLKSPYVQLKYLPKPWQFYMNPVCVFCYILHFAKNQNCWEWLQYSTATHPYDTVLYLPWNFPKYNWGKLEGFYFNRFIWNKFSNLTVHKAFGGFPLHCTLHYQCIVQLDRHYRPVNTFSVGKVKHVFLSTFWG